ncbi:MAG: hypothetical protein AAB536_02075 [Patescibacteria group bacterium]
MKKILITLTIVIVVVLIGFGGYYIRSRQGTPATDTTRETGSLPSDAGGTNAAAQNQSIESSLLSSLNSISQNQILDYFVNGENDYSIIKPDGAVIKISGGKEEVLSNGPVAGITSASFSYDGKRIMALVGGGSSRVKIEIFDFDQKNWRLLPNIAQSPVWSPDRHQIAFLSQIGQSSALYTLNVDDLRAKPVEITRIHQEDMILNWVSRSKIFFAEPPSGRWNSSLWSFDMANKSLSAILLDKPGLETIWGVSSSSASANAGLAITSDISGLGGRLRLINQGGKEIQNLNFLTLPSKCTFYNKPVAQNSTSSPASSASTSKTAPAAKTNTTLVCAVPRDSRILQNNPLPDAYQKKSIFTSDDFFEMDVSSGNAKSVFNDPKTGVDAEKLKVFGKSVFFINRLDQRAYSFSLPQ